MRICDIVMSKFNLGRLCVDVYVRVFEDLEAVRRRRFDGDVDGFVARLPAN